MNVPSFVNLSGAWFFLALIPLVILYFLKLKRPRMEIPSLALWQSVVNDQRVNSPFQKFRRNLLLLLQLILLCLLILALMQPFMSAGADDSEFLPILIDCSASMSATALDSDETRLEVAKERVREIIGNMGNRKIALFSFGSGGKRETEFTDDERVLLKALNRIEPTHRTSNLSEVLRMADAYSRTAQIDRAILVTDGNLKSQVDFDLPFEVQIESIPAGGGNIGITEFNARRSGPESWDIFVHITASAEDSVFGKVTLSMDGQVIGQENVIASREDPDRIVFEIDTSKPALLKAELVPEGFDALDLDNNAWMSLPKPRPLNIRSDPTLYSWNHAFSVLPDVDIDSGQESSSPEYDLIVTQSTDLKGSSAPVAIYIGVVPEDVADLISVSEVDVDDTPVQVIDWVNTAPLLRHVRLRDVQIAEKPQFAEGATDQKLEDRGFEVLVHGAEGPLVLQRRRGLETEYYFLFHTDRSTLPYRLAFPILVSNIIETAQQRASLSEVSAVPTGVLPPISVEPDREFTITGPSGDSQPVRSSENGLLTGIQGDRVGKYDVKDGDELVQSLGTGILSPLETSLRSVDELVFNEDMEVKTDTSEKVSSGRQLWWTLAMLAFVFLLIEWWYFQRQRTGVAT